MAPSVLDLYGPILGGGDYGGGFGNDSLSYLDAVLRGRQRYNFDRPFAQYPQQQQPEAAVPNMGMPEGSYLAFAEPPPRQVDVGTGIPIEPDRPMPATDNYTGTALEQLIGKLGDVGTGAAGLVERAQLGLENLFNPYVWAGGEPKRAKLPIAPGLEAAADAATFATGGLASSLFPAAGALRAGAQWAAPMAREAIGEAAPVVRGLLADETGALRLGGKTVAEDQPLRFSQPGLLASNPLPIPAEAETRLARKLARTDPTIGAPNNAAAIELPDGTFVGPVNVDQWIARNEKLMSPEEIDAAARWYQEALPAYQRHFGEEKAPAMMGAWLIANQNATPGFAQLSATRALEQYVNKTAGMPGSGVPGLAADKLAQYWDAIQSGNPEKFRELSTGQKIFDFIDSAAGKNTRTFYNDDPRAGAPAVADVHSLRDTGSIDPTMHAWIAKTYGDDVAARITPDPLASPSETRYEWAADRMRQWTDELNARNYRGRSNWTPAEVQAVGWKGMSALLGRAGQTAEEAIRANVRNLSYELDFGAGAPWNTSIPEWHGLTPAQKAEVSRPVLDSAMDFAKEITGAHEFNRLAGTGGWKADVNPAFRSSFISSPEVAGDVADIMGYLGQQTAVYSSRWQNSGKSLGLAIHGAGMDDPAVIRQFWSEVVQRHPDLAGGFSPATNASGVPGLEMTFEGAGTRLQKRIEQELLPTIDEISDRLGLANDAHMFRAETRLHGNDWQRNPDGGDYLQRLRARYGPEIQGRLDNHSRAQLEPALRKEIARVKAAGQVGFSEAAGQASGAAPKGLAGLVAGGGLLGSSLWDGYDRQSAAPGAAF